MNRIQSIKSRQGIFLIVPPDCHEELSSIAKKALKKADAFGMTPTLINDVLDASKIRLIEDVPDDREGFIQSLPERSRNAARSLIQKLRGIADLRQGAVWVKESTNPRRTLFPKAHEAAHQSIPWHRINPSYLDTSSTLRPDIRNQFDREANFTASEIIFQCELFRPKVLSYAASFDAIFTLADMHGATYQSTTWRYVEDHDEVIAVLQYYPTGIWDGTGNMILKHSGTIPSRRFRNKFADIEVPSYVASDNPWMDAINNRTICRGTDRLSCNSTDYLFSWESWWNGYTLLILLRQRPKLGVLGGIIRSSGFGQRKLRLPSKFS